jgi:hypothetical protein
MRKQRLDNLLLNIVAENEVAALPVEMQARQAARLHSNHFAQVLKAHAAKFMVGREMSKSAHEAKSLGDPKGFRTRLGKYIKVVACRGFPAVWMRQIQGLTSCECG